MVGITDSVVRGLFSIRDDLPPREHEVINSAVLMLQAIDRGGWDISPCGGCGDPVVCLPDGLPMCESCAGKAGG